MARLYGDRPNVIYELWNEPLQDHDWTKHYDLALEAFNRSAEAEATRGRFDKCMERVEVIMKHAKIKDVVKI